MQKKRKSLLIYMHACAGVRVEDDIGCERRLVTGAGVP